MLVDLASTGKIATVLSTSLVNQYEAAMACHADIVTFNVQDFQPPSHFGVRVFKRNEALKLYQRGLSHGEE